MASITIKEISEEDDEHVDQQTASLIRLRPIKNQYNYDKDELNNYEEALNKIGNKKTKS
jgi:hypothetical protein